MRDLWNWRKKRLVICLISFWLMGGLLGLLGALMKGMQGGVAPAYPSYLYLTMIIVIFSACTHRLEESIYKRIAWVIGLESAYGFLTGIFGLILAFSGMAGPRIDRVASFLGAWPILIFAMSRSRYFVVCDYYPMGHRYELNGKYKKAIMAYKKVLSSQPYYYYARYGMGTAYDMLGSYEKAADALKEAISVKHDAGWAYLRLAEVYRKLGKVREEIEAYKQAIEAHANLYQAYFDLGRAYMMLGRKDEALALHDILKGKNQTFATKLFDLIEEKQKKGLESEK